MIDEKQHTRIKAALALKGITLTSIARALDVKPTTVTIVSKGFRRSQRIEHAIAGALDCSPAQLWPTRYPDVKLPEKENPAA